MAPIMEGGGSKDESAVYNQYGKVSKGSSTTSVSREIGNSDGIWLAPGVHTVRVQMMRLHSPVEHCLD